MSLGTNIKEYRKAAGLTQEQLSRMIGVNRVTVTKYENGTIEPPFKMIKKVAGALNCTPFDLLGIEPPEIGEVLQIHAENGRITKVNRLTEEEAKEATRQAESDAEYLNKLSVPALKLNEIGRKVLFDNAESLAANEDMTK